MRNLLKIGFLAVAVVVAALGFSQEPNAESASNTEIIFSFSSTSPVPAPAIILNPSGDVRNVYVWAINIKEATGVSGFNIAIDFNESSFAAFAATGDADGIGDKTWLESTNRQGACVPDQNPQPGLLVGLCSTLTPPPPLGPTGSGLLGRIVLNPGSEMATASLLTFVPPANGVEGTFLLDTPSFPALDFQQIPVTLTSSTVVFFGCGDNNGDGVVDLPNDILGVILRFQMNSSDPDWDPAFDINSDTVIDLPNDILGTILQFQLHCLQT